MNKNNIISIFKNIQNYNKTIKLLRHELNVEFF